MTAFCYKTICFFGSADYWRSALSWGNGIGMGSILEEVDSDVGEVWLVGQGLLHILRHILVVLLGSREKLILKLRAFHSAEWGSEHLRISIRLV